MKTLFISFAVLVFLIAARPAHSMSVEFTGVYPMDASTAPSAAAFEYEVSTSAASGSGIPYTQVDPARASMIELPSFASPHLDSSALSTLRNRFSLGGARGSGALQKSTAPQLQDLLFILFLGIGMLSIGTLSRKSYPID
jgi:hypothetical protein